MGKLKPIGSEKLRGQDKIRRIMEIARYNEVEKNDDYHISTNSFSNNYTVVKSIPTGFHAKQFLLSDSVKKFDCYIWN